MERDGDHLRPSTPAATAPGDPLRLALEEARALRSAIHNDLFLATQDYRDAQASRPLDGLRLARTCGEMCRLEFAWFEQDLVVWSLRGQWDARRWRTDDVAEHVAA